MDIEIQLLKEYKDYINSKIDYPVKILPKTPQSLTTFPTILMRETDNSDYLGGKSLNGLEYVDRLTYSIEIYSKDTIVGAKLINSKQIVNELKQLTFEFFRQAGFERISCNIGEYTDFTVDRVIIIEQGKLNNWNKKII